MKSKIIFLFIPILCVFLCGSSLDTDKIIDEQINIAAESNFFENISEETFEILELIGIEKPSADIISNLDFSDFLKLIYESILAKIKEPIYAAVSVTAAALICALIHSFSGNFYQTGKVINTVSALAVSGIFLLPIHNVINSAAKVIEECSGFMLGFIPVYSSAIISSGYISSATGFRTLMLGASAVISRLSNEIIVPLICIYLALCVTGAVSEIDLGEISKSIKNFAIWLFACSMTVFSGIMGLGTLIASSADSTFSKTAKFLISSTIPIVGGTVADAVSTVKSCLGVTKNVLGAYAIIVIAAIFLPSVFSLISWKICLSVSSAIGGIFGNKTLSGLLSSASAVMGIMIALVAVTAVTFIFSIAIMLMNGGV